MTPEEIAALSPADLLAQAIRCTCTVVGCANQTRSGGLCGAHIFRLKRGVTLEAPVQARTKNGSMYKFLTENYQTTSVIATKANQNAKGVRACLYGLYRRGKIEKMQAQVNGYTLSYWRLKK